jgi:hypothetical protein
MNVPELAALVATALNASIPVEKRRAALAVLDKMGISKLPISEDQKIALVWEQVLTESPEDRAARHAAQETARIAKEDAEHRHCAGCFWRVPVAEAEESCPKCNGTSWSKPSELSPEEARFGAMTDIWRGDADEYTLRSHLLSGGSDLGRSRKEAQTIIKIMQARGYEIPTPPYGSWPHQYFISAQDEPLPEPKVPVSPGKWGAVYNPPDEFQVW